MAGEQPASELRVAVLFSERTDLVRALAELAAAGSGVTLVAAATDRGHDPSTIPANVPRREFPNAQFGDRVLRDRALAEWLTSHRAQLVVCAGWLWLLSTEFLDQFPDRVLNVHPTLPPAFAGRHSVEAAVAFGVHAGPRAPGLAHGALEHRPPRNRPNLDTRDVDPCRRRG